MVLYFIGLGLGDEKDITVKGLEIVKKCTRVYLEAYTAVLGVNRTKLEQFYGRKVIEADRKMVEQQAEVIMKDSDKEDVALLVVGDSLAATTHTDLFVRAYELGIPVKVIHNASIMNAVASCGMQLYNFGQTISIPYFSDNWVPDSFYWKVKKNMDNDFHTMCLLDIKVKEQSDENLAKGLEVYEPPRFMTNNEAIQQLLVTEEKYGEKVYGPDSPAIGLARVGRDTQKIVAGTMKELMEQVDFGAPLHTLVIPAKMHDIEKAMWEFYHWNREGRREQIKKEAVEAEAKRVGEIEARAAEKKRKKHEWEAAQKRKKEEEKLSAAAAALKVADPESESESESDDGDDNGFSLA